jgi:hypothetical protein
MSLVALYNIHKAKRSSNRFVVFSLYVKVLAKHVYDGLNSQYFEEISLSAQSSIVHIAFSYILIYVPLSRWMLHMFFSASCSGAVNTGTGCAVIFFAVKVRLPASLTC